MLVSPTELAQDKHPLALLNALTVQPSRNTLALMVQSDNPKELSKSNPKSSPTDPLKVPSLSTLTSSTIKLVSIPPPLLMLPVVTPSKSSVGELKTVLLTGSALTHGVPHGESADSSRLPKVSAELRTKSSHAPQTSNERVHEFFVILIFE